MNIFLFSLGGLFILLAIILSVRDQMRSEGESWGNKKTKFKALSFFILGVILVFCNVLSL